MKSIYKKSLNLTYTFVLILVTTLLLLKYNLIDDSDISHNSILTDDSSQPTKAKPKKLQASTDVDSMIEDKKIDIEFDESFKNTDNVAFEDLAIIFISIDKSSVVDLHNFFINLVHKGVDVASFINYLIENSLVDANRNLGGELSINSPLQLAITYSPNLSLDSAKRLIGNGCYAEFTERFILSISRLSQIETIKFLLKESGYGVESASRLLSSAAEAGNGKLVQYLIEYQLSYVDHREVFDKLYLKVDTPISVLSKANFVSRSLGDSHSSEFFMRMYVKEIKQEVSLLNALMNFSSISENERADLVEKISFYKNEIDRIAGKI